MASFLRLNTIWLILLLSPPCWARLIPSYKPAVEDTADFRLNLRGPFVNGTHSYSNSTLLGSNATLLALNSTSISNSSLHGVSTTRPVISSASITNYSSLRTKTTVSTIHLTDDVDEQDELFVDEGEDHLTYELEDDEEEVDSNSSSLGNCIIQPNTNSTSISKRSISPCNGQPFLGSTKTAAKRPTKKKEKKKNKPPKLPHLSCDPIFFDFSNLTNRNSASDYIDYFSRYSLHRQKELFKLKGNSKEFTIPQQREIDIHENEIKLFGMTNLGTTKNHFDCDLEKGCSNVPTCDEILNHTRDEFLNAPPEERIVYDEEAVREHARKIWFAVQSIIGMNEQYQFKHRVLTRAHNLTTTFLTFPGTQKPWEYANWKSTNAEFEAQPWARKLLPRLFLDRSWYRWTYKRWTGVGQEARFKGNANNPDYCPKCLCWSILEANKVIQSVLPDLTIENYMPHAALNISERHVKFRDNFLAQQKDIAKKEDSLLINDRENWLYISPNSHYKMDRLEDDKICDTFFWNEFKEDPTWNGDNSGMNIGLMPWKNILGIAAHHRKLLLHVASRPMKETQFLVPTLVKEKILVVEKMWERLRSGYLVGDEKFGTGADGEGMKRSIAEWMREGLLWDPVEYETMERAVKGASCKLSMDIMSTFYQTFQADDVDDSSYQRIFDGVTENTVYTKRKPARREKDLPLKPEDEAKWWGVCERDDFEAFGRPLVGEIPKEDIKKGLW